MNIRQINNKNMKRLAIGAGVSAIALFLAAGLVSGRHSTLAETTNVPAAATESTTPNVAVVITEASQPTLTIAPVAQATSSTPKAAPAVKKSKKKVVHTAPAVTTIAEPTPIEPTSPAAADATPTSAPTTGDIAPVVVAEAQTEPLIADVTLDCLNRGLRVTLEASAPSGIRKVEAFRANDENAEVRYALSWYGPDSINGKTYGAVNVDGAIKSVRIVATANDGTTTQVTKSFSLPC